MRTGKRTEGSGMREAGSVRRMRCGVAFALALFVVPALPAQTVAVTGGKVYPVSGPPIENGKIGRASCRERV